MKAEKGNWPAQPTQAILRSVKQVLESGDITQLTQAAYKHITLHMGFIAHCDLAGFQGAYRDVAHFARRLLSSEYTNDRDRNRRDADRYTRVPYFAEQYGRAYCQSVVDCNAGIVALAEANLARLVREARQSERQNKMSLLARLAEELGFTISEKKQVAA